MKIGTKAPDFRLKDRSGKQHSLKDFKSNYVVVYFYPKDDTPGCTIQAKGFSKNLAALKKLGAEVVGISGGNDRTKDQFCKKYKLSVLLLSDPDFAISKKYGAYGAKTFMGRKTKGIYRRTYLLDKNRTVVMAFEKVDPEAHPQEIAKVLATLGKSAKSSTKAKTTAATLPAKKMAAKKLPVKKITPKKITAKKLTAPAKTSTKPVGLKKVATKRPGATLGKKAAPKGQATKKSVVGKRSTSRRTGR